jgi:hypothetical protein
MKSNRYLLSVLAVAATFGLGACGGGGGGSSSGTAPSASGVVNVQVTDGPSDEFQHVWVTIKAIAFHTDPNQSWNPADATWQVTTLPSPVTIDLTALNNGVLNDLFAGMNLPAGSYKQIRFFFDSAESSLTTSALDTIDSNGAALQWNDQVEYLSSTGAVLESPLEIPYPIQGIQLTGSFNVTSGSTLTLAVDFDLEHSVVPFLHDSMTYFTLRPDLHYYDMSQVAAITGQVDPSKLCQSVPAAISQATTCAFNLVVKAELLTADGSRHAVVRQTTVDPITGNFTLYPLATKDANGNAIAAYDVVLRGREMETMLVTGVPVTMGSSPGTGTGVIPPTNIQSTPIEPVLNSGEYTAQLASALAPLTSGYVIFQQTLPGSGNVPYEIRWRNTDPFTGFFRNPIPLQDASSMLQLGAYNGDNAVTFSAVTPGEGAGAFTVADNEAVYYSLSPGSVMAAPTTGTTQTFVPGIPTLDGGVSNGTVNVTLAFSGISVDNNCELVLARFATIADTYNCSSLLSNSTPASFSVTNVPSGSASNPVLGAYYYAYVRLWETGNGKATRKIVPLPGFIDLRTTNTATLNGSVPGA